MKEEPMCSSAKSKDDSDCKLNTQECSKCEMHFLCWGNEKIICNKCHGSDAKRYLIRCEIYGICFDVRMNLCESCKKEYENTINLSPM